MEPNFLFTNINGAKLLILQILMEPNFLFTNIHGAKLLISKY